VKADVLRYAEQQKGTPEVQEAPVPTAMETLETAAPAASVKVAVPGGAVPEPERRPFRGLRREIARRLRESKDRAVHTLHVDEADLTELVALRQRMKPFAEEEGVRLTYLPFLIKAVIAALRRHPEFNATVDDEAGEMLLHRTYNIGIAVATDQGLVVPVIHHAERYSLLDLARKVTDLADRARAGKLTLEDVEGGTFSITNIGSIGGLFSFPVINYPQVAILGFHSIKPRPVVVDGAVQIRQMTYFSLAFDHRVVDGAQAAWFTRDLIRFLETPDRLFLESV
jgi:pyruvate dehydrogenase E2 component (dihydrolipoamide acetyltransferase)